MQTIKIIFGILVFCILTILTQVGGLVYLASLLTYVLINKWTKNKTIRSLSKVISFLFLYTITTFLIVPFVAKPFGRVRLPITEKNNLQPLNTLTCFLNRNYVRPELRQTAFQVAKEMNDKFPGTTVNYLDANFPFINKFPLLPHLSHNDGKKLDLSFCYNDANTGESTNSCPSFIGYGICEEPYNDETNTADFCAKNGYWQYSFLTKVISQESKQNFSLNNEKTRRLVYLFASKQTIGEIFLEPHLKTRLKLKSEKIRFHGCQAVRHDDHIHVQLK